MFFIDCGRKADEGLDLSHQETLYLSRLLGESSILPFMWGKGNKIP